MVCSPSYHDKKVITVKKLLTRLSKEKITPKLQTSVHAERVQEKIGPCPEKESGMHNFTVRKKQVHAQKRCHFAHFYCAL